MQGEGRECCSCRVVEGRGRQQSERELWRQARELSFDSSKLEDIQQINGVITFTF